VQQARSKSIVALLAFRTPWETLAVVGGKGVWDAIFILPQASMPWDSPNSGIECSNQCCGKMRRPVTLF
jgi:hypothetical protein